VTENSGNRKKEAWIIPSREEHNKLIRFIWRACIGGALFSFIAMAGTVLTMYLMGRDTKKIVEVQLIMVYLILPAYAIGYVAPTLATSLIKMSLGVEMSRRGLDIGEQTADTLDTFQRETKPMIDKSERVLTKVEGIVDEFKSKDLSKLHVAVDRMANEMDGGGKLDRLVVALEKIAARTSEKADEHLEGLLGEAWAEDQPTGPVDSAPKAG